jgi:hypothetical protein
MVIELILILTAIYKTALFRNDVNTTVTGYNALFCTQTPLHGTSCLTTERSPISAALRILCQNFYVMSLKIPLAEIFNKLHLTHTELGDSRPCSYM